MVVRGTSLKESKKALLYTRRIIVSSFVRRRSGINKSTDISSLIIFNCNIILQAHRIEGQRAVTPPKKSPPGRFLIVAPQVKDLPSGLESEDRQLGSQLRTCYKTDFRGLGHIRNFSFYRRLNEQSLWEGRPRDIPTNSYQNRYRSLERLHAP
ncbi:hypothetical protein SISSUDRAFT_652340 [Sistotremastrum suecicum HHB10207 ss-3]|uniref:Uncharacterized protein n=1 Tax=Sistotremastrum suecicum HHB10207 ss-3 TaxID=1314776 RepID=A0A166E805_9AGAM|nr:hypothetical protein SISSUDRAFT_652340 [Sistotremastrum suecicum HHB10207 ss-3]